MRRRGGCSLRAGARPLRASPWLLLCLGPRSSRSLGFRVRKRRWLYDKEFLSAGSVPAPTHREWRRVFEFLASGADSSGSVTPASGPPSSRAKRQLRHSQSPPARPARTAAVPTRPVPDSTCSTSANARLLRPPAVQGAAGSPVRHDERRSLLELPQAARASRAGTSNPERSTPSGSRSISSGCASKTRQLWPILIAAGGMPWTVIVVQERTRAGAGMTMAEWCTPTRLHSCSSG
jgi:hypothetical protein